MVAKKDEIGFKKAIEELEEINEWFSGEEINLEEGLRKLKRGKELILTCQKRLTEVETEFIDIKDELDESTNDEESGLESIEEEIYPENLL